MTDKIIKYKLINNDEWERKLVQYTNTRRELNEDFIHTYLTFASNPF